ncbi:MAG: protein translocase subunit SecDF [Bacteroidales bacterium]|jgi:SecD/SecF fusion protein|nr:protein translocase subunit SecDF [Bacteroidales bacterium]
MRNKGAVITILVLLTLIVLYYLSFSLKTFQVEKNAKAQAVELADRNLGEAADADKYEFYVDSVESSYLDSISGEVIYNFLGKHTYLDCKASEINLGLDLKGGMNVTLEIKAEDMVKALANDKRNPKLIEALQIAEENQTKGSESFVVLFVEAYESIAPGESIAPLFITPQNKEKITISSPNEDVQQYLMEETQAAYNNAFDILRKRIDHFGVVQPNIQRDVAVKGRFHIELPGIKDPERVRDLLQGTAKLGFYETYEFAEIIASLQQAENTIAKSIMKDETTVDDTPETETEETTQEVEQTEEADSITQTDEVPDFLENEEIEPGVKTVEEDVVDTTETSQLAQQKQYKKDHPLFALLQPSINQEGQAAKGPVVGTAHFKDTARINRYLNMKEVRSILPIDLKFAWTFKAIPNAEGGVMEGYFNLIALKETRKGGPVLSGDVVEKATKEFSNSGGAAAEVTMLMNSEGAKEWAKITENNINRSIAIVLDGYVYSYPNVSGKIPGGRSSITGNFTPEEAEDLANVLKSGKMPAPARIISEEIVGPTLGQKAIDSGLKSFIIAFLVVLLYMIFYYNRAGLVADIALIANIFFIFGSLAAFGAVLTLPGIAGIVLTIGMSVDANVLIYERIREELAAGKGLKLAISDGYKNAYSAILDANITTLLVAIILFKFGVGPIQGFATTLIIGILSSLFTAIFITRLIFSAMMGKDKVVKFDTKLTRNAFKNLEIKFLAKRKIAYIVSGIFIVIALGSLVTRGLNPGIDFTGGRTFVVKFDQDIEVQNVASTLEMSFGERPMVKSFGGSDQVKIVTKYKIDDNSKSVDNEVDSLVYAGLKTQLGDDVTMDQFQKEYKQSSQKVGPSIADDILRKSFFAVGLALIIIFLYILIRFQKWQYSLGAIAALVHDVLFVLGLFSLFYAIMPFSMEIDQAFIAAILTVVGYSINDTVVVFDRIREFFKIHPKRSEEVNINNALNSTISRTFSTSLSTFFVLLTIFIFGGEVIRGFIFALMVGIVVGTYSSLFVATPVAFEMMKKKYMKK